ncbi:hypothetical protein BsWGS_26558 [Bradybaena similaris]
MVAESAFVACKIGDINTVRKLPNVDQTLVDNNGACCLHYAARGGSLTVVEFLVKSRNFSVLAQTKTGATALHDAAAKGNTAVVKWLIENGGVDVSILDGAGVTALHLAARYCHFLTVEWLLDEANANASIRSNEGALPLHFAVVGGDMNCVKILVDENPRLINMQTNNGTAPIYLASQAGHLEILQYLISRNAATKVKAYDAMSCLHAAAQNGHLDVVKWLVTVDKSNPNDRDFDGNTPLHFAAGRGHPDIVKWLLKEGGAKVTLDNLGGSPLHTAAEMGELQCVQALLDCGCDVDLTDNAGLTAAELADKCGQVQAAALIRGEVTLADLGLHHSTTLPTNNEKQLPSSNLSFQPAPALSPKGIQATTASPISRSSHTQPLYSPPLPPPPAHPHSLASTPSTADSPISPPPPIHEDGKESVGTVGYGVFKKSVEANRTEQRPMRRTTSELSVDSSASNFGVFEQQDAGVVHTVTAEIHKTPRFVPPTPRPVTNPAVPGHGSLNSTQESVIFSTSSSSFSQEESSPVPIRKIVGQKSARFFEDFNNKGVSELRHQNHQQHYYQHPTSPPLAHSTLAHKKDPLKGSFSSNSSHTQNTSLTNDSHSSNDDDSSYSITSVREAVKEINKFQYYSTPYKQDFNTVTKSSFAKAKALFQYNRVNGTHICPDNGEVCPNNEREYYPLNQVSSPGKMDSPRKPEPENISSKPVVEVSHSNHSSETQKSVIAIQGSHATIISTGSHQEKMEVDRVKESKQAKPLVTASAVEVHKNTMMNELRNKSASQMTNSHSSVTSTVVNGHTETVGHFSGVSGTTRLATVPHHLAINGDVVKQNDRPTGSRAYSRSSSGSSTSSQTFSPVESKHNLIADIHSAVSGTSNLSLRRTKGKGEGVSMVYQSKKGGAGHGEVKVDSSPLTGQFDPKNFLDKVETVDATGRAIPEWRRQVLAKHLAEKAQKEYEEKKSVEDYEARFKDVPAWKRALIEKKEAQTRESPSTYKK